MLTISVITIQAVDNLILVMKQLNFELKQLCERNRDGSFGTQAKRQKTLQLIANQLEALGFQKMRAQSLRPKHTERLVKSYLAEDLSVGTIKNRLTALRWWAEKINKRNVVARDNEHYGIPDRDYSDKNSKAKELDETKLAKIDDVYVRMSLRLQQAFGLRREEAIKFIPNYADQGDHIRLKPTWTKGGKARTVPVKTKEQRAILDEARKLASKGSLIPLHLNYIQQLRIYEKQTHRAGLSKMHGLRHRYAQQCYEELTGWKCPHAGGPTSKQLRPEQKTTDREARLLISRQLGHDREQITAIYLGR